MLVSVGRLAATAAKDKAGDANELAIVDSRSARVAMTSTQIGTMEKAHGRLGKIAHIASGAFIAVDAAHLNVEQIIGGGTTMVDGTPAGNVHNRVNGRILCGQLNFVDVRVVFERGAETEYGNIVTDTSTPVIGMHLDSCDILVGLMTIQLQAARLHGQYAR